MPEHSTWYSTTPAASIARYTLPAQRGWLIPNARCPVCGALVFFYANAYGSRVFFDAMGPPWPKHPCTDHGYRRGGVRAALQGLRSSFRETKQRDQRAWYVLDTAIWSGRTVLALARRPAVSAELWLDLAALTPISAGQLIFTQSTGISFVRPGQTVSEWVDVLHWCSPQTHWVDAPLPKSIVSRS